MTPEPDRILGVAMRGVYRRGDDLFKVQTLCREPTVTFVNVATGETFGMAIGSPLYHEFQELVPKP